MKILDLFNIYFLILMIIPAVIVGFYDYQKFYNEGKKATAKKAKIIGISLIAISIAVVALQKFI